MLSNAFLFRLNKGFDTINQTKKDSIVNEIFQKSSQYQFEKRQKQQDFFLQECEKHYKFIESKIAADPSLSMTTFMNNFNYYGGDSSKFLKSANISKYTPYISPGEIKQFSKTYKQLRRVMCQGYQDSMKLSSDLRKTPGLKYDIFTTEGNTLRQAYTLSEKGMAKWMGLSPSDFALSFSSSKENKFGVDLIFSGKMNQFQVEQRMARIESIQERERKKMLSGKSTETMIDYYIKKGIYREGTNGEAPKLIDLTTLKEDFKALTFARDIGRVINAKTGETNIAISRLTEMLPDEAIVKQAYAIKEANGKGKIGGIQKYLDNLDTFAGADIEFRTEEEYSVKTFTGGGNKPNVISYTLLNNVYDNFKDIKSIEKIADNIIKQGADLKSPKPNRTKVVSEFVLQAKKTIEGEAVLKAKQQANNSKKDYTYFLDSVHKALLELDDENFINMCMENNLLDMDKVEEWGAEAASEDQEIE